MAADGVAVLCGVVTRGASSVCRFAWKEFACFQISKSADRFELHVRGSEAWIEGREEASRVELEGSIDCRCLYLQLELFGWTELQETTV